MFPFILQQFFLPFSFTIFSPKSYSSWEVICTFWEVGRTVLPVIFFPLQCHQINLRHILISNISAKQRRPREYGGGIFTSKSLILSLDAHILSHSLLVSTSYMTTHKCKRNWEHVIICSSGHHLLLEPSLTREAFNPHLKVNNPKSDSKSQGDTASDLPSSHMVPHVLVTKCYIICCPWIHTSMHTHALAWK